MEHKKKKEKQGSEEEEEEEEGLWLGEDDASMIDVEGVYMCFMSLCMCVSVSHNNEKHPIKQALSFYLTLHNSLTCVIRNSHT